LQCNRRLSRNIADSTDCSVKPAQPHYLLFPETAADAGRWRFLLRSADGSERFEAADVEPGVQGDRLDLLTVVRALESLDQPSRVTVVGSSRYVRHGMQYGLVDWRSNGWRWESFGQWVPVKNGDLWQRLDRALRYHRVECRQRRFDPPHMQSPAPHAPRGEIGEAIGGKRIRVSRPGSVGYWASLLSPQWRRLAIVLRSWRQRAVRSWTVPKPGVTAG
jgi:ribonuclease HI